MQALYQLSHIFFVNWVFLVLTYNMLKTQRTKLLRWPIFDDFVLLTAATIPLTLIIFFAIKWLMIVAFILYLLIFILIWLDAFSYVQYGLEVNLSAIKFFCQNPKALMEENGAIDWDLERDFWFYLLPAFYVVLLFLNLFYFSATIGWQNWLVIGFIVLYAFTASKSTLRGLSYLAWLVAAAILYALFSYAVFPLYVNYTSLINPIASIIILSLMIIGTILRLRSNRLFFSAKSFMRQVIIENNLSPSQDVELTPADQALIARKQFSQQTSSAFGSLANKHVVLIAVESFAKNVFPKLKLPYIEQLQQAAIISDCHYAPCPNTKRFLENLYLADYPSDDQASLLKPLSQAGYHNVFLSSDDLSRYAIEDTLHQLNFKTLFDKRTLAEKSKQPLDYMMQTAVPEISEIAKTQPLFLHIHNVATHVPYQVSNKEIFNRFNNSTRIGRYLNSLEEYDTVLAELMLKLHQQINLDDAIIILLGDHGQAFGKMGYKCHSNATINDEVIVPFFIHHNQLEQPAINTSSHFSVLPSLLDLLGINYHSQHAAVSSFVNPKQRPELLYSETIAGNAPANIGIFIGDEKIMIDRTTQVHYLLDQNDNIVEILSGKKLQYYQTLIYQMAKERGLLNVNYTH
jgi:glucan phosphoethanolaminetransferase (alkaline phosphatase superfamily)